MSKTHRIGQVLVDAGAITPEQLEAALARQQGAKENGRRQKIGAILVGMGAITEEGLARALASQLGLPYVELDDIAGDPNLTGIIPRRLAERHTLVPIRSTADGVELAMADPTDIVAIDDIRATRVGRVTVACAPAGDIRRTIARFYSSEVDAADVLKRLGVAADATVAPEETTDQDAFEEAERVARGVGPVVQLANAILADAITARATDVHVEPQGDGVRVRYRVDGLLRDVMTLPKSVHLALVSRLKIASGMDIAERRRPQDGRGRLSIDGREISLRLSTAPTLQGEKVAIRLLRQDERVATLADLGFDQEDYLLVKEALDAPQGFLLFTGPTGAGKTTSMYAALTSIANAELNIITLEDPIEYQLPGVNQTQIDERTGITFAKGLRSMLRQDPNVIMVGEIRDEDTASMALQSAMTGHLVLSTVHTNDAVSAIARLMDLGVEPFLISGALSVVIAQRLVRVICPHCKQPAQPNETIMARLGIGPDALEGATVYRGVGCPACGFTGYQGRTGVYQVMPMTRAIRSQIASTLSESALADATRAAGVRTLLDAGLKKVRDGITTLEEVLRSIKTEDVERRPTCPACRHEIDLTFVVCPHCQYTLNGSKCPECSRDVAPEWTFCAYCRAQLNRWTAKSHPRVLVADDDASVRTVISAMLSDDFEVLEASGGEEALRHAVLYRPDVILLDLSMPDLDGIELAKRLRASAATSVIPLIVVTGDDSREVEGLRAGVDDYIVKPFDEPRLRARIDRAISRH